MPRKKPPTTDAKKKHIVVAEDNAFLAEMLARCLRDKKMRVSIASTGEEALKLIEKSPPSLLLLDLLLPQTDGFGVLEKRVEEGWDFPVVVCSNISDKVSRDRCKSLGVKSYLIKSDIDDEQLWPTVEKFLR